MQILVIDDDLPFLEVASAAAKASGHDVLTARTFRQADQHLKQSSIDIVFLEINPDKGDGLAYLEHLNKNHERTHVIALTDNACIADAVDSMSRGAVTFFQKPIVQEQIMELLAEVEKSAQSKMDSCATVEKVSDNRGQHDGGNIILQSHESAMQKILSIIEKSAQTDASILLLGPSGTGKTVMAKHIHNQSNRSEKPFVTVSCPSLSRELLDSELFGYRKGAFTGATQDTEGKVHAAEGGTLFLDEIGEMPTELQPKLLRLLQEQEYERLGDTQTQKANIRLITATNRDIQNEVSKKRFREDLLFRLNVITIQMPALKERLADLPMLIEWFLSFYKRKHNRAELRMDDKAKEAFLQYEWPGNLREMGNIMERCVILAEQKVITLEDLPQTMKNPQNHQQTVEVGKSVSLSQIEEAHIIKVLETSNSLEEASETLDIDKATLYRKRKKLGIA